jgi:hypothetical protein
MKISQACLRHHDKFIIFNLHADASKSASATASGIAQAAFRRRSRDLPCSTAQLTRANNHCMHGMLAH